MKRRCFALALAVAASTLIGLAEPSVAGEQVPFRGRFGGTAITVSFNFPISVGLTTGSGIGTHLGQFAFEHPHTANVATFQLAGTFNFVAANGDKIFADFSGQSSATSVPGVRKVVGTGTITGGTGRFAGATGSFVIHRLFDSIHSTTIGTFDGTISSPGAARR